MPSSVLKFALAVGLVVSGVTSFLLPDPALAAAAPATGTPGQYRFGIEPASASGIDGRPGFAIGATPGAVVFDHVALLNYSNTPLTLLLSAADATETNLGGFGLQPPGQTSVGVGAWIAGPPGDASVGVPAAKGNAPGEVVVPFTVKVPLDAVPGDHVGAILATLQTVGTNRTGQRVILNQRVGTRVFIRVSGVILPRVAITSVHADYSGTLNPLGRGVVTVEYVVSNTGNVDVALTAQRINVSGVVDDTHAASAGKIALLLPGASVAERVEVQSEWPQILLHASVAIQPVLLNGVGSSPMVRVTSSTTVWAVPWTLLFLVVLVAGGLWYWRRRARIARANRPPTHARSTRARRSRESKPTGVSVGV
jgi:hypothetical protein